MLSNLVLLLSFDDELSQAGGATTLYVGTDQDYQSIQAAVDGAEPGNTIYVQNGNYNEHIQINKSLTIIGEDKESTEINGSFIHADALIKINSDDVTITGFSIVTRYYDDPEFIIKIMNSNYCNISQNYIFSQANNGIFVDNSENNTFVGNYIDSESYRTGIKLNNSHNNRFSGNKFYESENGLYLERSDGNDIDSNQFYNNSRGIQLIVSNSNRLMHNVFENGIYQGIHLANSKNCILINNTFLNDSLAVGGYSLEMWNSHNIDTTNTVNGKPIYYWKNRTGGNISGDAGLVILANCSDILISNLSFSEGNAAVMVGFSDNITIMNSSIKSSTGTLIFLFLTNNSVIEKNIFDANTYYFYGIHLVQSNNNTVNNNIITDSWIGISAFNSNDNILHNNSVINSSIGIIQEVGNRNYFYDNVVTIGEQALYRDYDIGLGIYGNENLIGNNTCSGFNNGIVVYGTGNVISNNSCTSNVVNGLLIADSGNLIENNHIYSNIGSGIIAEGSGHSIKNNIIENNELHGLVLKESKSIEVKDNIFTDDGLFIEGDLIAHWNSHDIGLSNTVNGRPIYYWHDRNGGTVPAGAGQVILANTRNVIVRDQQLSNTSIGIQLGFSNGNSINNNSIVNIVYGIQLTSSDNNIIQDNKLSDCWFGLHIGYYDYLLEHANTISSTYFRWMWVPKFYSSNYTTIENNILTSNKFGIFIFHSENISVTENELKQNQFGILFAYAKNSEITGNDISYNVNGTNIHYCEYISLLRNTIEFNSRNGINFRGTDNSRIINNEINSNGLNGTIFWSSENNIVANNSFANNQNYAIFCYSSYANLIYNNNFIDNARQVYEESSFYTRFYYDHIYGGNYWSDHTGPDKKKGYYQNEKGSDGFIDEPYLLFEGWVLDEYPLVGPANTNNFDELPPSLVDTEDPPPFWDDDDDGDDLDSALIIMDIIIYIMFGLMVVIIIYRIREAKKSGKFKKENVKTAIKGKTTRINIGLAILFVAMMLLIFISIFSSFINNSGERFDINGRMYGFHDMDNDGDLDALVMGQRILYNNDGDFSSYKQIDVGDEDWGILVVDLNGDDLLDIVNEEIIYFNDENNDFTRTVEFYNSSEYSFGFELVDWNLDGYPDLVDSSIDETWVITNNGNETFSEPVLYDELYYITESDHNLDGITDIILVYDLNLTILLRNTSGVYDTIIAEMDMSFKWHSRDLYEPEVLDADSDGDTDIIIWNSSEPILLIREDLYNYSVINPVVRWSRFYYDFNNDGLLDLLVFSADSAGELEIPYKMGIMFADDNFNFSKPVYYKTHSLNLNIADIDSDGDLDIISTNSDEASITVFKNNGKGGFKSREDYPVVGFKIFGTGLIDPGHTEFVDIDHDGDTDIITINYNGGSVTVMKNDGDGGFKSFREYEITYTTLFFEDIVDLDGDGYEDIIVLPNEGFFGPDWPIMTVLYNDGDGYFYDYFDILERFLLIITIQVTIGFIGLTAYVTRKKAKELKEAEEQRKKEEEEGGDGVD